MSERESKSTTHYEFVKGEDPVAQTSSARDQLLSKVLGETLDRRQQDPADLVAVLRQWRSNLSQTLDVESFELEVCEAMVSRILHHRLGASFSEIPMQLHHDVAEALWNNPESRMRMERLWNSLDPHRSGQTS